MLVLSNEFLGMVAMNEFRKPYEYEEESGVAGFILIFFLMLVAVEPLVSFNLAHMSQLILSPFTVIRWIFIGLFVIQIILLLFTCVALFRIHGIALKAVRIYLLYRVFFLCLAVVIVFVRYLQYQLEPTAGPSMFESVPELVIYQLVFPLLYIILFSVLWNIYFKKSKRVKSTYLKQQ